MKIILDKEKCIGCGTCESICNEIFAAGDDSKAHLKGAAQQQMTEETEIGQSPCAEEAADSCAVQAIQIQK